MTLRLRRDVARGALAVWLAAMGSAHAQPASKLGGDEYTCMGAERAGNDQGVADYTGKWFKQWPGLQAESGYVPGPYADEKPLFTITADNMAEYADRLTAGEKALLKRYDGFRMHVYPSHRDFRPADWQCEAVAYNARHAQLVKNGLGVTGHGGAPPFPFPENGQQAIWNVLRPVHAWTGEVTYDIRDVYSNGKASRGRMHLKTMSPVSNPDPAEREDYGSKIFVYFFAEMLLPAREKGKVGVGFQPNSYEDGSTQAWAYQPGLRRVKKSPEVGFDYPVPPAGLRTSDSDGVFNGSPERFNWKLVGKKTIFVPYNDFRINDPSLSYDDILGKHTLNPKYVRYEPHRVWVIEGTLKEGVRHIFKRRVVYADEDTWLGLTGDNYDRRGQLYRMPMILHFRSQQSGTYHRGVSVFHTLTSGAYEATYLVNERDDDQWWQINRPMRKQEFSPEAALRAGQ